MEARTVSVQAPPTDRIPATALSVEGLSKVYPSRSRGPVHAVSEVSFSVGQGEVVGLLGPNGAGKTTTIKCICTLIRPTSGRITVQGVDAVANPRRAVANVSAVLEGNRNIYWRLTARENLEFFAGLYGIPPSQSRPHAEELLARFRLEAKADTEARKLSRGMQQKLAVACSFIRQTKVLLLDEPTLGLDVETAYELRETLKTTAREESRTILLSSHDMDVVQDVCDRVIIINEGHIVTDDSVANLLELFRVRRYRFTLSGSVDEGSEAALVQRFPHLQMSTADYQTVVEVSLPEPREIYDFVDTLRSTGVTIESIDRVDPDLEEIFLRILRGESVR